MCAPVKQFRVQMRMNKWEGTAQVVARLSVFVLLAECRTLLLLGTWMDMKWKETKTERKCRQREE